MSFLTIINLSEEVRYEIYPFEIAVTKSPFI